MIEKDNFKNPPLLLVYYPFPLFKRLHLHYNLKILFFHYRSKNIHLSFTKKKQIALLIFVNIG